MDISKLDRGLQIVGGAAIVLLISLFLPWYSVSASLGPGLAKVSSSISGWQALSFIDLLLFLLSAAAIGAVVAAAMGKLPELPAPLQQILLGIAGFATLLVLFRLLFTPGDGGGLVDIGRSVGVFIALIAAGAMVYGALQTTDTSGLAGPSSPDGRPAASPPAAGQSPTSRPPTSPPPTSQPPTSPPPAGRPPSSP